MGYGGSFRDAGQAIGKERDGGIDEIIKEDRLGWMLSTFRLSDGKDLWAGLKSRNSLELYRDNARERVFS